MEIWRDYSLLVQGKFKGGKEEFINRYGQLAHDMARGSSYEVKDAAVKRLYDEGYLKRPDGTLCIGADGHTGTERQLAERELAQKIENTHPTALGTTLYLAGKAVGASPETLEKLYQLGDRTGDLALIAATVSGKSAPDVSPRAGAAYGKPRTAPDGPTGPKVERPGTQRSDIDPAMSQVIRRLDEPGNPFQQQGKGLRSTPLTMDIDEPSAVGQQGISSTEARARAMDANNREFLDPNTNRITKHLGTDTRPLPAARSPVSASDDPNVLITRRFSEITEMPAIFNEASARIQDPSRLSPTELKNRINSNVWDIIKNGKSEAAIKVRGALEKLGFENVEGQGYVLKPGSPKIKDAGNAPEPGKTADTTGPVKGRDSQLVRDMRTEAPPAKPPDAGRP
jgi:hypothetical protein